MKIRRFTNKKRLNEDDAVQQQQQTAPANAQTAPAQPALQAPAAAAPQPQQAPAQQPAPANNQPQQQQPAQAAPQQNDELAKQVTTFFDNVRNNLSSGNIYWALATNLADELQKTVPTFNVNNQAAKPGIDAWAAFKADPNEQKFNAFVDSVVAFAAPQQAPEEQAQQAQKLEDSLVIDFGSRLEERLQRNEAIDTYARYIAMGFAD